MKLLGAPATVAALALALAVLLHPAVPWGSRPESVSILSAAAALLLACALGARAVAGRTSDRLLALGALAVLAGFAGDGIRAHRGSVVLRPGQGANKFDEEGTRGSGLRPFGFETRLAKAEGDGAVLLFPPEVEVRVSPRHAAAHKGFRFGDPLFSATGEAESLTVRVEGNAGARTVTIVPGATARSEDLDMALERYFPDFALDDEQRPFTRSHESHNPAALLEVKRGDRAFRVFVIRSLPGLHRVADLDASFALLEVRPERALRLHVAKEPFAPLVASGGLLVLAAALLALRDREKGR